jgi:signal transduction histidine kinase
VAVNTKKALYDGFSVREANLKTAFTTTRFTLIENFLQSEILKYDYFIKENRDKDLLSNYDFVDITSPEDTLTENLLTSRSQAELRAKVYWMAKISKTQREFSNRSKIVRNTFQRTHVFFDELNEMEIRFLKSKHDREISKQKAVLRLDDEDSLLYVGGVREAELSQQRQIQNLALENLKEMFLKTIQKELTSLHDHLDSLDALSEKVRIVFLEAMSERLESVDIVYNMKERNLRRRHVFIDNARKSCVEEIDYQERLEKRENEKQISDILEESKSRRLRNFSGSESVIAPDFLFNITLGGDRKLYSIEDVSSVDHLEPDEEIFMRTERRQTEAKERYKAKREIEKLYKSKISSFLEELQEDEHKCVQECRNRENAKFKKSLKIYVDMQTRLEEDMKSKLEHQRSDMKRLRDEHTRSMSELSTRTEREMDATRKRGAVTYQTEKNAYDKKTVDEIELRNESRSRTARKDNVEDHESVASKQTSIVSVHVFHELRNVLASILCLGDQIVLDKDGAVPLVKEMKDVCTYAISTMNDMIDIAKLAEGNVEIEKKPFLVLDLLNESVHLQGPRKKDGVSVTVKMTNRSPHRFDPKLSIAFSSAKMLRQIFVNLMSNALKFTENGYVSPVCNVESDWIELGVEDSGPGVKDEVMSNINNDESATDDSKAFEYAKASGLSVKSFVEGDYAIRNSGYGLFLAKKILNALGSKLMVKRNDGGGSFFFFRIERFPLDMLKKIIPSLTGKLKVLVVDDRQLSRFAGVICVKKLCEKYENLICEVHTECSAEGAVRLFSRTKFDIVLLDEFYDNVILSKDMARLAITRNSNQIKPTEPPCLLFDGDAESNGSKFIDFKSKETFDIRDKDGTSLGTDVSKNFESAIVVHASGSDIKKDVILLKKPYEYEHLVSCIQENLPNLLAKGIVNFDCKFVNKNECTLFEYVSK